jgi:hypothetical protein
MLPEEWRNTTKLALKPGQKSSWLSWPLTGAYDGYLCAYMEDNFANRDLRVGVWIVKVLFSDGTSWTDDGRRRSRQVIVAGGSIKRLDLSTSRQSAPMGEAIGAACHFETILYHFSQSSFFRSSDGHA